ncbi:MAG: DnaD domain protein [Mycoplasmatales bacterium]
MTNYKKYSNFSIPTILMEKQKQIALTDSEFLMLIRILSFNQEKIAYSVLANQFEVDREIISKLKELKMIDIIQENTKVYITISPLYNHLFDQKCEDTPVTSQLSADVLDRISFLLNRQVKVFELEKIKEWCEQGYKIEEIEVAIQKSIINNVDNFNYIQTVLYNVNKKDEIEEVKVQRNIEFY